MKIYDISQEIFSGNVYPGDLAPTYERVSKISDGSLYNLTDFHMSAHNGTHIDAPYHFYEEGKTIDNISLTRCVGPCSVVSIEGQSLDKIREVLKKSNSRILVKGDTVITTEIAGVINECNIRLVGVEGQCVGPEEAPMAVHLELLGKDVVLLEGIVLDTIEEGDYFLSAAPIKLGGSDGAPCRALLIDFR